MATSGLYHADSWRYHTSILSISDIRQYYLAHLQIIRKDFNVFPDQFEDLYDWLIIQALQNILIHYSTSVKYHYVHDVYRCIFDVYGPVIERMIKRQCEFHNLHFHPYTGVKALVTGDALIISRGQ